MGSPIPSSETGAAKRKDGTPVCVYSNQVLFKNLQGDYLKLYCIDIDLTELKEARRELLQSEEQIRESELYHRSLLQTLPVHIFVLEQGGMFSWMSSRVGITVMIFPSDWISWGGMSAK
jgi:PAS domain-containing protein